MKIISQALTLLGYGSSQPVIKRDKRRDSLESNTISPAQCTYYRACPDGTVCYQPKVEHFALLDDKSQIPDIVALESRLL